MCLDSRKFLATTDGKQIRLFPENYSVLSRERTKIWNLDLDPAVDEELAVAIFRAFHTNRNVRWGRKEITLEALNALLEPVESLEPCFGDKGEWELDEQIRDQFV